MCCFRWRGAADTIDDVSFTSFIPSTVTPSTGRHSTRPGTSASTGEGRPSTAGTGPPARGRAPAAAVGDAASSSRPISRVPTSCHPETCRRSACDRWPTCCAPRQRKRRLRRPVRVISIIIVVTTADRGMKDRRVASSSSSRGISLIKLCGLQTLKQPLLLVTRAVFVNTGQFFNASTVFVTGHTAPELLVCRYGNGVGHTSSLVSVGIGDLRPGLPSQYSLTTEAHSAWPSLLWLVQSVLAMVSATGKKRRVLRSSGPCCHDCWHTGCSHELGSNPYWIKARVCSVPS